MDRPTSTTINKLNDYDKLQQILDKVRDLKQSLANFFAEYEHGQPSWPTILDQMNVLLSQIATLRITVRHSLTSLRVNSIIPMCLSPDVDPNVEQLTERRLAIFNHDFMPQLLRTKNLPEIEERERLLNSNSSLNSTNPSFPRTNPNPNDVYQRVQELNSSINNITEIFRHTKEMTDKSDRQFDSQRYTNQQDGKHLLEAMNYGVGLKGPNTSSSPITTNDQTNLNQQMPTQPQRPQAPSVRIKTVPKPNR
jgi:mediator of RNA polymerase II transcription subunit 8